MNLTNTFSVLVLATENNPIPESESIIDRQISLSDMGAMVAAGVNRQTLHADCNWIQGFYKHVTVALQFIKERDMATMTKPLQAAAAGAKLSIRFEQADGIKLSDFLDETVGDIVLDLRHIANQRPTLAYMAEQHQVRMEEFLSMHRMPLLAQLCRVSVDDSGMNFQLSL